MRQAFPQVPTGIASLTNRVLPYVFPTTSDGALEEVLHRGYGIERPPPEVTSGEEISTFDALDDVAHHDFYGAQVKKRVLLVLSDAETLPFRIKHVGVDLERAGIRTVVVRFWRPDERIFRLDNRTERYRPSAPHELDVLRARGWTAFDETQFAAVRQVVAGTVGHGPRAHRRARAARPAGRPVRGGARARAAARPALAAPRAATDNRGPGGAILRRARACQSRRPRYVWGVTTFDCEPCALVASTRTVDAQLPIALQSWSWTRPAPAVNEPSEPVDERRPFACEYVSSPARSFVAK